MTAQTLAPRGDLATLDQILDEIRGPIALALAMNRPDHVALVFRTHEFEIEQAYIAEHDLYPWRNGPITETVPTGLSLVAIADAAIYGEPDTTPIPIRHEAEVA